MLKNDAAPETLAVARGRVPPEKVQWVVVLDNRFVPGSSTQLSDTDSKGNTYQLRHLADGSEHRVRA